MTSDSRHFQWPSITNPRFQPFLFDPGSDTHNPSVREFPHHAHSAERRHDGLINSIENQLGGPVV